MDDSILRSRKSILIIININANLQIVIGLYDCASWKELANQSCSIPDRPFQDLHLELFALGTDRRQEAVVPAVYPKEQPAPLAIGLQARQAQEP